MPAIVHVLALRTASAQNAARIRPRAANAHRRLPSVARRAVDHEVIEFADARADDDADVIASDEQVAGHGARVIDRRDTTARP